MCAVTHLRGEQSLDPAAGDGIGEKWLDSGNVLRVEFTEILCNQKRSKHESYVLHLKGVIRVSELVERIILTLECMLLCFVMLCAPQDFIPLFKKN